MVSLASYGACQSACNAGAVACYSAAGLTFGTVTAGAGMPATAAACNSAVLAPCMSLCATKFLAEASAETLASGGAMGPVIGLGGVGMAGAAIWKYTRAAGATGTAAAGETAAIGGTAGALGALLLAYSVVSIGVGAWKYFTRDDNGNTEENWSAAFPTNMRVHVQVPETLSDQNAELARELKDRYKEYLGLYAKVLRIENGKVIIQLERSRFMETARWLAFMSNEIAISHHIIVPILNGDEEAARLRGLGLESEIEEESEGSKNKRLATADAVEDPASKRVKTEPAATDPHSEFLFSLREEA